MASSVLGHGQDGAGFGASLEGGHERCRRATARSDLGVLAPGKLADIVAMPGDPIADIDATARWIS
jgi:hypothetical protein